MPGEVPPPATYHTTGSDTVCEEEEEGERTTQGVKSLSGLELLLEPMEPLLSQSRSLPVLEMNDNGQGCLPLGTLSQDGCLPLGTLSQDGCLPLGTLIQDGYLPLRTLSHDGCLPLGALRQDGCPVFDECVQLERRWVLWHEFMKEYSSLDDWLRLAERSAGAPNSAHVLFVTAKDELRKFESLWVEAGVRLVQLDGLTQRSWILTRLFNGTMRARLVAMARDCGERWDLLSRNVESICRRLKHLVSQREEYEERREEMAVWLADMDLRLTEVEHSSGTCEKMVELQSFQQVVGENAGRLNRLLEQAEVLIQRSEPEDAQDIEAGLQELLQYCARVFEGVGHLHTRLHTRLLSMRLVFEDDWLLAPAPDSGCPSETLLEEEAPPDPSTGPSSPPLDHLVLEWDPSVDIGGSVFHDDTDTGPCRREQPLAREPVKRRSYLSSIGSQSDIISSSGGADRRPERGFERAGQEEPMMVRDGRAVLPNCATTSTPNGPRPPESSVTFDPTARISAWLGQTHGHAPTVRERRPCSKAVQTDRAPQCAGCSEGSHGLRDVLAQTCSCRQHTQGQCDYQLHSYSRSCKRLSNPKSQEEELWCKGPWEAEVQSRQSYLSKERPVRQPTSHPHPWIAETPVFTYLLLALPRLLLLLLLFLLLAWLAMDILEPDCQRSNALARSFHLALRYVNGPPPT